MPEPIQDPRLTRRRPTDAELAKASEITEDDVAAAVEAWRRYAPPEAKGMLDAEPVEGE